MSQLRSEELVYESGELIAELLSIKPSLTLVKYARKWLLRFPDAYSAPEVVGRWMTAYPDKEVADLAKKYLKETQDCEALFRIVDAVFEIPPRPALYKLIELRMEETPGAFVWARSLAIHEPSKRVERLAIKLIDLNKNNPDFVATGMALLSKSPVILEKTFEWIRIIGYNTERTAMDLSGVIRSSAHFHRDFLPKVVRYTRKWLTANQRNNELGRTYSALIAETRSPADIEAAKRWYTANKSSSSAWAILHAILNNTFKYGDKVDEFAVDQAKQLLFGLKGKKDIPALVGSLVSANPDDETIALAKHTYNTTKIVWILERLLLVAPDSELIQEGNKVLKEIKGSDIEHKLLHALLTADSSNTKVRRRATFWLKQNPKHSYAKAIKQLLNSQQKSLRD